jgi:hypothetical protein
MQKTVERIKRLWSWRSLVSLVGWFPWLWARIGDILRVKTILELSGVNVNPILARIIATAENHGWIFGIVWLVLVITWPDIKRKFSKDEPITLSGTPAATYRDWEFLDYDFNTLAGKDISASLTRVDGIEVWDINGSTEENRDRILVVCMKAGETLLRSPKVRLTLSTAIIEEKDHLNRWLSLFKIYLVGNYAIHPSGDSVYLGTVADLAGRSKTLCIRYSVVEKSAD